ncbi:MAG TPA: hypothetical protein VF463_08040 [Sphingobium sp.]
MNIDLITDKCNKPSHAPRNCPLLIGLLFLDIFIRHVSSRPAKDASSGAERDDPATSMIWSRRLVGAHFFQPGVHEWLCFAIDRRPYQIAVYSDETR